MVDGSAASTTDPRTWTDYASVSHLPNGVMLGDGLACWDLDHVLGEEGVHPDARAVLGGVDALWVERSMSGTGLHVFVEGDGVSFQRERVSYYSHSRFIAVTGERWWG